MNMDDEHSEFPTDGTDRAISAVSTLATLVPWLGGPVSNVVGGYGQARKFNRVQGLLDELAGRLSDFESEVSQEYVRTEDFEELLEHTLRRAADERSSEVRDLYLRFIYKAIIDPGDEYDDQIEVLHAIARLREVHITVMRALLMEPSPDASKKWAGSPRQTLQERTGLDANQITGAVETLNDLKLTNLESLGTMMTGHGSETLSHAVTQLGLRVLEYLDREDWSTADK